MNWDWDKLQEKRQNQPNWNAGGKGNRKDEPDGDTPRGQRNGDEFKKNNRQAPRPPRGDGRDPLEALRGLRVPGGKWWLLGVVVAWLISGIYIVDADEAGVVLRFGRYVRTTSPGPHYHAPYPIEQVFRPKVSVVRQTEVGYISQASGGTFQQGRIQPVDEESAMLTGDENIVHVQFNIQYNVKSVSDDPNGSSAVDYLFNVTQPDAVVKKAAEAAMREIIGKTTLDNALTGGRIKIQDDVTELLQSILDRYRVGIQVVAVQMQDVQPPREVRDAFKDVASAREDKQLVTNQAEAYRRDILPKAQGLAAEIVNQAEGYKQTRILLAEGEARRFLSVLAEYNKAQDVTRKRMLFETMEDILSQPGLDKLILPSDVGDRVLPLLPLDNMRGGSSGMFRPSANPVNPTGPSNGSTGNSSSVSGTSAVGGAAGGLATMPGTSGEATSRTSVSASRGGN